MPMVSLDEVRSKVGQTIGVSDWIEVGQDRINVFADATEDRQFIHTDPIAAASHSPFGGTIAHGFLTLSLLSRMAVDVMHVPDTMTMAVRLWESRGNIMGLPEWSFSAGDSHSRV